MLRDEIVKRIDGFGGIEKLTASLMEYKRTTPRVERVVYNRLASYFNHVYSFDVNVEAKAIKHKKLTVWAVNYLGSKLREKDAEIIRLCRSMLQLKLDHVKGVETLH